MSVSNISQATSSSNQSSTSNTVSDQLGKSDFLKLLIVQLKNQDPLSPMDNTEYVAQLAQFSSLEQLQNLNASVSELVSQQENNSSSQSLLLAVNLLGKEVEASDPDTGQSYSGLVQGFRSSDDVLYLTVNGNEIPSSWITSVQSAGTEADGNG